MIKIQIILSYEDYKKMTSMILEEKNLEKVLQNMVDIEFDKIRVYVRELVKKELAFQKIERLQSLQLNDKSRKVK